MYGLITNYIVIPEASFVIYGTLVLLVIGAVPYLGAWLVMLYSGVVDWLNLLIKGISEWPFAVLECKVSLF